MADQKYPATTRCMCLEIDCPVCQRKPFGCRYHIHSVSLCVMVYFANCQNGVQPPQRHPPAGGAVGTSRPTRGGTTRGQNGCQRHQDPPLSLEAGKNSAHENAYIETSHGAHGACNSLHTTTEIRGRDKQTDCQQQRNNTWLPLPLRMCKEHRGTKGAKEKFVVRTTSVGNFAETPRICVVNSAVNLKHEISHAN